MNRLRDYFRNKEKQFFDFIKHNRTKTLLDFFRKNSAVIIVVMSTFIVAAGNVNSQRQEGGFLLGYFQNQVSANDKLEQKAKNQSFSNNLTMVPLAMASNVGNDDENLPPEARMTEEEMNLNQMQQQVLTATTPPDAKKLLDEGADVVVYEVKDGDTVSTIAQEFHITTNTILWANDIDNVDKIMPGDKIFILPVTGVQHVVKKGDTLKSIAKKYKADEQQIIAFNSLDDDDSLKEGIELVIPDGQIEQPQQQNTASTPDNVLQRRNYYNGTDNAGTASRGPSIIDKSPAGGHRFPVGYCTWYVASKKHVPWGGNAGTWLYHAKAYGASTGKTPKVGSIMVTNESWYGHVAIVEKVSGGNITVSEMNYVGWNKKSTRTLSSNSRVIKGFIY